MSITLLRPVLRPTHHPSLLSSLPTSSSPSISITSSTSTSIPHTPITTSIIQSRHARLLRRPKRPYTFTQLVTLSDGSAFTMRTTSPAPVYRSSRDTRNAPLWNPSSKELANVEDDEAGRLAGFRARFGLGFDAAKSIEGEEVVTIRPMIPAQISKGQTQGVATEGGEDGNQLRPTATSSTTTSTSTSTDGETDVKAKVAEEDMEEYYEFEEDDANLLDLISSYGQAPSAASKPPPATAAKKGKK